MVKRVGKKKKKRNPVSEILQDIYYLLHINALIAKKGRGFQAELIMVIKNDNRERLLAGIHYMISITHYLGWIVIFWFWKFWENGPVKNRPD